MEEDDARRRPIKERSTGWARQLARMAAGAGLTPNQISLLSVAISAGAFVCLWQHGFRAGNFWLAGILITSRLICNMIDGMVAVEHNKKSPSGEIFNELPDRLSDTFSILGAAYACGLPQLGLWASLLAVLTAYVRTLCTGAGAPADFGGPMAKQQRMKLLIAACVFSALRPQWSGWLFGFALAVILVGSAYTCWRRVTKAIRHLESAQ